MPNISYADKFKDPRWQKKRLEIMQRDGFKCVDCREEKETLNVHHLYYIKGRNPWAYPDFAMKTLCRSCHECKHSEEDADIQAEWETGIGSLLDHGELFAFEFAVALDFCRAHTGLQPKEILEKMLRYASNMEALK